MSIEKKDPKTMTDQEIFDEMKKKIKESSKKNPVKKLIKAVKKLEETH